MWIFVNWGDREREREEDVTERTCMWKRDRIGWMWEHKFWKEIGFLKSHIRMKKKVVLKTLPLWHDGVPCTWFQLTNSGHNYQPQVSALTSPKSSKQGTYKWLMANNRACKQSVFRCQRSHCISSSVHVSSFVYLQLALPWFNDFVTSHHYQRRIKALCTSNS